MEIAALESDGKQMEWSGNGTKQAEIMQKIFPHFFVSCAAKSDRLNCTFPALSLSARPCIMAVENSERNE